MPITEHQRQRRVETMRHRLGCSDLPALMGFSPWTNAADLWYRATGRVTTEIEPNEAMDLGNALEPAILEYAEGQLGKLLRNQFRVHQTGMLAAHLDAIVVATNEPVNAKSSGFGGTMSDQWGEPGTDQVPDYVLIQATGEMLVMGAKVCRIPAWLRGRGRVMFSVTLNERVGTLILERLAQFFDHVRRDVPLDVIPSMEILRAIKREPNKVISLPPSLAEMVVRRDDLKKSASHVQAALDAADQILINALGDAECGVIPEYGVVTYKTVSRKGYTVEPTTYRRLSVDPGKFLEVTHVSGDSESGLEAGAGPNARLGRDDEGAGGCAALACPPGLVCSQGPAGGEQGTQPAQLPEGLVSQGADSGGGTRPRSRRVARKRVSDSVQG